jgi:hypothetical protein
MGDLVDGFIMGPWSGRETIVGVSWTLWFVIEPSSAWILRARTSR